MKIRLIFSILFFGLYTAKADYVELIDDRIYYGVITEINSDYVIINSGNKNKISWSNINSIVINRDKRRGYHTPGIHGYKIVTCKNKEIDWDDLYFKIKTKNGNVFMSDKIRVLESGRLYVRDYKNGKYTRRFITWKSELKSIEKICPP